MRRTSTCTARPEVLRHAGRYVRILIDGPRTDGTYTVLEIRARPGEGPPLHLHANEDEHLTVLEGRIAVTLDREEHVLEPGDELTLPRGVPHHVRATSDEARYLAVCTPAGIEDFLRATREEPDGVPIDDDDLAAHLAGAGLRHIRPAAAPPHAAR